MIVVPAADLFVKSMLNTNFFFFVKNCCQNRTEYAFILRARLGLKNSLFHLTLRMVETMQELRGLKT